MTTSIKSTIASVLKQNLLPGLVLQIFAAIILLLYFFVPASKPVFSWFGALKQHYGFVYSFFATAVFGGAIPFVYLWRSKQLDATKNLLGLLTFYCVFWGLKGMEVDLFYRLQSEWFGSANNLQTIASKMLVDQFIYSPFWAAPSITLTYLWAEHGYRFSAWRHAINREFLCVKLPTVIVSNWLVWVPAVSIIYSMPSELQMPLCNLVLCFWVLMLAMLNKKC
jgi:hypothetical protein